jgi:hypothetical protein
MKLALASLFFAAPAVAFAPARSFGVNTALKMSTETSEEKVRILSMEFTQKNVLFGRLIDILYCLTWRKQLDV